MSFIKRKSQQEDDLGFGNRPIGEKSDWIIEFKLDNSASNN